MKHETKPTDVGMNRTGIGTSPFAAKRTKEEARQGIAQPSFDNVLIESERTAYSQEAEPVGTMPPPVSLKGVAKTAVKMVKGDKATVLLDLLGERLAFERTGTRLYEALLAKVKAADPHPGGPSVEDVLEIRDDELTHVVLLHLAIERMGADPTVLTPCADVTAVASSGLLKAVTDPRTTLTQALKAILIAELTDGDGWTFLADLAEGMGEQDLASECRDALLKEEEHLARVRTWVQAAVEGEAGLDKAPLAPEPAPAAP
jgi:hypothetical protein